MHDVSNIWRVPLMMQAQGAHETICRLLGLGGAARCDTSLWRTKIADKWDKLTEVRTGGARLPAGRCPPAAGLGWLAAGWEDGGAAG